MKTPHLFGAALLALAASTAQSQSLQLNGNVLTAGCGNGAFSLGVDAQGIDTGTWQSHTTADIGAARYMDAFNGNLSMANAPASWGLGDANDTGTQTHTFPLPPATPFTVTITLRNAAGHPVYRTQGTVTPGCDATGTPPSLTGITHTPLGGGGSGGTVAVPTLGHAALGLLGALVGGMGLRAKRRTKS